MKLALLLVTAISAVIAAPEDWNFPSGRTGKTATEKPVVTKPNQLTWNFDQPTDGKCPDPWSLDRVVSPTVEWNLTYQLSPSPSHSGIITNPQAAISELLEELNRDVQVKGKPRMLVSPPLPF